MKVWVVLSFLGKFQLKTSASNGSLIEWKIALFHKKFRTFKVNFLCQKLSQSF
jgi:hypothetical protein